MRTEVSLHHLPRTPQLRSIVNQLEEKADRLLGRFGRSVQSAEVVVRGGDAHHGPDLRCTVRVALDRGKAVVVKATGATPAAAAAEALLRARRTVAKRLDALTRHTNRATLRRSPA
ncbi:HPF/RaiA family ribosome-associated protein [Alienimonas californiensis]|uniref:Sigma 54 modulation protein / S30EA ribosomal protein n=1 Tax=Alienimonas californiensis TaxID=2527989 RepID=A0A517P7M5_9PLAN|nr:HPF/RaiA family ribosome-associated protein [Alienimonas californiensis]QDT15372.1 hypothetical protein CA12_14570 [Alienimonas californiensis]